VIDNVFKIAVMAMMAYLVATQPLNCAAPKPPDAPVVDPNGGDAPDDPDADPADDGGAEAAKKKPHPKPQPKPAPKPHPKPQPKPQPPAPPQPGPLTPLGKAVRNYRNTLVPAFLTVGQRVATDPSLATADDVLNAYRQHGVPLAQTLHDVVRQYCDGQGTITDREGLSAVLLAIPRELAEPRELTKPEFDL
jgi:hypothetical protein